MNWSEKKRRKGKIKGRVHELKCKFSDHWIWLRDRGYNKWKQNVSWASSLVWLGEERREKTREREGQSDSESSENCNNNTQIHTHTHTHSLTHSFKGCHLQRHVRFTFSFHSFIHAS
jgi:hypothetical protein